MTQPSKQPTVRIRDGKGLAADYALFQELQKTSVAAVDPNLQSKTSADRCINL